MNDDHARLVAELQALAETTLDRIEPLVERLAAGEIPGIPGADAPEFTGCHWCPVCALAALVRGEQHELLAALSGHALTIVMLLREILAEHGTRTPPEGGGPDAGPPAGDSPDATESPGPSGFVPIAVTIRT
ncbi:hypothetical protein G4H71_00990 [Rhodococcus triatomae]|uniref:Uncharacterized protein n=1 Tax=Rhodococcus triatomae TaxID=300028 RepID=A0A1G8D5S7_9NOCA|nr:hypothetical protein [Rhodococcus triatomae]QNG18509.1 hypothetical protein G4H72_07060 [Rhodococcus triatomae]QNG21822.1 hypothetical protein G4H71_00990 [Rhodococcus triatomae]SDH52709.1 hypothetical protein SAMN05444695_102201 [Rhodococcus triatomae]